MNRRRRSPEDPLTGLTIGFVLFLLGGFVVLLLRLFKRNKTVPPYAPISIDSDKTVRSFSFSIRPMSVSEIVTAMLPLFVLAVSIGTGILISRYVVGSATLVSLIVVGLVLALLTLLVIAIVLSLP